jgi:predicted ABC-type ATPase
MRYPTLVIVGGPNGSGKSTHSTPYLEEGLLFLNPDEIARAINPADVRASALEAGRVVLNYARQLIMQDRSFAIETTLSGTTQLRLIAEAQKRNFKTLLIYLGTENPSINITRVAARVAQGGHDIPKKDVVRRWHRSIQGYRRYVALVDEAMLVDCSSDSPRFFARFENGVLTSGMPPFPAWAQLG